MKPTDTGSSNRVTLSDIARLAGVSVTTVSRVLGGRGGQVKISDSTADRILKIAREQDYRPNLFAKALRTNKSHLIGLIVWDFADPYYGAVVVGAQNALAHYGYTAVLTDARRSESELCASLSRMGAFQTDGALVVGGPAGLSGCSLDAIRDDPGRVVLVGTSSERSAGASVVVDNYEGGRLGVDYLIRQWQRPLVWLRPKEGNYDVQERVRGIEAGVAAHQFETEFTTHVAELGEEGGYAACSDLLRTTRPPFSLFAFTDLTAIGALHAARDAGLRVPEDVAVLGFDDLSLAAHVNPPLSTVRQPRQALGTRGAELLVEQLGMSDRDRDGERVVETLTTELVIRETA